MNQNYFEFITSYLLKRYINNDIESMCGKNHILYNNLLIGFKKTIFLEISETLVSEYHLMKNKKELTGENRNERMIEFIKIISNPEYIENFLNKYEILDKLLCIKTRDLLQESNEIVSHYINDYKKLCNLFGCDIGKLVNINFSQGDLHCGRTVSIVETEKIKIVYKPRNSLPEQLLKELMCLSLKYIRRELSFRYPLFYGGSDYIWQEYIEYKTCVSMQQIKDFYYKSGMYLAIFYVLGSTDLHYENLVSCGEHPMFIDLETLINGSFNDDSYIQHFRDLNSSVLKTAMLPIIDKSSTFDINMSALFTGNKASKTMYGTVLIEDDENDWVFLNVPYSAQTVSNIATLNNKLIKPDLVIKDLISGFRDVSSVMINNKKIFMSVFNNEKYKKMEIRQLLRPTRVYSKFLSAAHNPAALKSIQLFNKIFDILTDNFKAGKFGYLRVEKEVESLKKGYIPSFHVFYNDKNLYYDNILVCENYYYKSPQESILQKLSALDNDLVDYQVRLIELSVATTYNETDIFMKTTYDIDTNEYWDKESLIAEANKYFTNYLKYAIYPNSNEITMETLIIKKDMVQLGLMNSGLYNDGGTILLLALFGKKYNKYFEDSSKKMIELLINQYRYQKMSKDYQPDFSVFSSNGGLIYLIYNFYKIFGDEYYLSFYKEIEQDCLDYILTNIEKMNLDYLNGSSGIIYLLTKIYLDNDKIIPIEKLNTVMDKYLNHISDNYKTYMQIGLAHGLSGILMALFNIYIITKNNNTKKLIFDITEYENELIKEKINECPMTWCNGLVGMLYIRNGIYDYFGVENSNRDCVIDIINNKLKNKMYNQFFSNKNLCLCHGIYGNVDIFRKIDLIKQNMPLQRISLKKIFNDFDNLKWLKIDMKFDSFMLGTPGVIYSLLSLYENYPSILALDIYKE